MDDLAYLFEDLKYNTVTARFERLESPPPEALISNVNLVPTIGDRFVVIRVEGGRYEIPGGTLEADEHYLDGLRRELLEEAGAEMLSFQLVGAWRCHSKGDQPYRPHLPHPDFYRVVGVGEVRLVAAPSNPPDGEQVVAVEVVTLDEAVTRFIGSQRPDLADLYRLAGRVRNEKKF